MLGDKKILAVIPARGGSKGLPGKNKRLLAGKPLVAWPISAAKGCCLVDKIICTTDDPEIQKIAIENGAIAPFLRPKELASDVASSIDAVLHAVNYLENLSEHYDYVVLLEPTSPLTTSEDIEKAIKKLDRSRHIACSIVGISKVESMHPEYDVRLSETCLISPYLSSNFRSLRRRQEIEPLFYFEGSLYISSTEDLKTYHSFYHERTLGYEVPKWKAIEIDDIFDFLMVETLLGNMNLLKNQDE